MDEQNYLTINQASWNKRTETHVHSAFYDTDSFLRGKSSLNEIELNLLGDVKGLSILHLQCHFGQDSISLSKMGAEVVGVDFSDKAIEYARDFASQMQTNTRFVCCDIYELTEHLNEKFDIVFTSYGTIGWLPDLDKWAKVVSSFLKPNGRFVFVEFHPVVWMFDDDFEKVAYRYFNSGPIIENETGTYADKKADLNLSYVMWNHSLSEVFNALLKNGVEIKSLDEFDYSPYNCFSHVVESEPNKFRIKHLDDKIPMVYAIQAIKKSPH